MQRIFENWRDFVTEREGDADEKDTDQVGLVIILDSHERALILKRSKEVGFGAGQWSIPGGHIQEGETFEEGAIREVKEETNLEVTNLEHIKSAGRLHYYISHGFGGDVKINFEHTDSVWVNEENMNEYDIIEETKNILENLFKNK